MVSEVYNCDCMEYMKGLPDKFFDLAIADPPYGIGVGKKTVFTDGKRHGRSHAPRSFFEVKDWDDAAPGEEFFSELIRVSRNQVIWGANHFISRIPFDSSCWIVWDKENGNNDFADCELAWTSFKSSVRQFRFRWSGMLQGDMSHKEKRIHPTQKPVALYAWLLKNYGVGCRKIFDPMMGSQSSRIASFKMGYDYYGCELDADYFSKGCERFEYECHGVEKLANGMTVTQMSLFDD